MSIEVRNLTYIYNKDTAMEKVALNNVNFKIETGEFIGLIGHTGSGKSTLIQHLNALIKPTDGEILLNNENIHNDVKNLKNIRKKVGLVFQYPEHQLFEMTIFKDVSYGPKNLGLSVEEINERVISALETVGMGKEFYEKSPFELSGGQKRRVAIAGILAMNPEVLILDEPTAGLDPKGRDEILSAIKNMHEKLGITVILVSHSMEDVAKFVNRILVMDRGNLVLNGSPEEIFSKSETLEKIGLGAPQVSYIMKELSNKGFNVPLYVYTIDDATEVIYKLIKGDK